MRTIITRLLLNRWAAFTHDLLCVPLALLVAQLIGILMIVTQAHFAVRHDSELSCDGAGPRRKSQHANS